VRAKLPDGAPYSGKAGDTQGMLDWFGHFENGLPDGEFKLYLADRPFKTMMFSKGEIVE